MSQSATCRSTKPFDTISLPGEGGKKPPTHFKGVLNEWMKDNKSPLQPRATLLAYTWWLIKPPFEGFTTNMVLAHFSLPSAFLLGQFQGNTYRAIKYLWVFKLWVFPVHWARKATVILQIGTQHFNRDSQSFLWLPWWLIFIFSSYKRQCSGQRGWTDPRGVSHLSWQVPPPCYADTLGFAAEGRRCPRPGVADGCRSSWVWALPPGCSLGVSPSAGGRCAGKKAALAPCPVLSCFPNLPAPLLLRRTSRQTHAERTAEENLSAQRNALPKYRSQEIFIYFNLLCFLPPLLLSS